MSQRPQHPLFMALPAPTQLPAVVLCPRAMYCGVWLPGPCTTTGWRRGGGRQSSSGPAAQPASCQACRPPWAAALSPCRRACAPSFLQQAAAGRGGRLLEVRSAAGLIRRCLLWWFEQPCFCTACNQVHNSVQRVRFCRPLPACTACRSGSFETVSTRRTSFHCAQRHMLHACCRGMKKARAGGICTAFTMFLVPALPKGVTLFMSEPHRRCTAEAQE